jgi:hypothetical protein
MTTVVSLKRFLLNHPRLAVEQESIITSNARARRLGKPLPHPYLITCGPGKPALVDMDAAKAWAMSKGKNYIFEGKGAA